MVAIRPPEEGDLKWAEALCLESRGAPYCGTEGGRLRNGTVVCKGTDASPATAKRCGASVGDGDGARVGEANPDRSRRESMVGKAACSKGPVRTRAVGRLVPTRSCSAPPPRRPSSSWWRGTLPPERVAVPFRALSTPRTAPSGYGRRRRPVPGTPDDGIRRLCPVTKTRDSCSPARPARSTSPPTPGGGRSFRSSRRRGPPGERARPRADLRGAALLAQRATLGTYTKSSGATPCRSHSMPTRTSYPQRRRDESTPRRLRFAGRSSRPALASVASLKRADWMATCGVTRRDRARNTFVARKTCAL